MGPNSNLSLCFILVIRSKERVITTNNFSHIRILIHVHFHVLQHIICKDCYLLYQQKFCVWKKFCYLKTIYVWFLLDWGGMSRSSIHILLGWMCPKREYMDESKKNMKEIAQHNFLLLYSLNNSHIRMTRLSSSVYIWIFYLLFCIFGYITNSCISVCFCAYILGSR